MTILLAGDIGGTKTSLRVVESEYSDNTNNLPEQTTLYEKTYPSQKYSDLVPMLQEFVQEATENLNQSFKVEKACFGIAGPVVNNISELTNLNWYLDGDRLRQDLFLNKVTLINDYAAIGYGILGLSSDDLYILQDVQSDPQAPIAILGAGTGLGECFLVPSTVGNPRVFASEGSHADFAPRSALEFELLNYISEKYNLERVSVERVVSGKGIATIYQFLRDRYPDKESETLARIYNIWQDDPDKNTDLSAEISKKAINKDDFLCQQAMQLFVKAYGAEAGNLALKLLPYGGLYVVGGFASKILPLMRQGDFLEAFYAKGRMRTLMQKIPVYIVLNPKVGLIGAALYAAR
ncbi:MAG: glucokinase [cyanobacterium endosymbiont of Rhopalodia musculus]|uniref:glucokinase n=1 Tax=cyanobacterium endosymbiont of Epithemia clementina EcSB TaxID=3034674 RepID=UPI0024800653|nr:glucokinase [cyanobacterium endosymbiont of Epithemia clementina EcSB]WGT67462.1 glucokinase [cyanobacterium endosymbiont of Epithemia clementina EcSB]